MKPLFLLFFLISFFAYGQSKKITIELIELKEDYSEKPVELALTLMGLSQNKTLRGNKMDFDISIAKPNSKLLFQLEGNKYDLLGFPATNITNKIEVSQHNPHQRLYVVQKGNQFIKPKIAVMLFCENKEGGFVSNDVILSDANAALSMVHKGYFEVISSEERVISSIRNNGLSDHLFCDIRGASAIERF